MKVFLDTVGGDARDRAARVLRSGGNLVSVVSSGPMPTRSDVHSVFFYVEVTTERLNKISALFNRGELPRQDCSADCRMNRQAWSDVESVR